MSLTLKAGDTPSDETTREQEAARLRIYTDQLSAGSNFIVVGDFNLYRATEPAYIRLLDQTNPGYFLDPVNRPGYWNNNASFADVHTQSTRVATLPDGGSNGGLDDRFDFILVSQAIMNFGELIMCPVHIGHMETMVSTSISKLLILLIRYQNKLRLLYTMFLIICQ